MRKHNRKSSKVIRFGIGHPSTHAFAVWRLWVQGNEVYLSVRSSTQQMKASLHSSWRWYFMMSNKQGFSAKRPSPIIPGLTRGPGVIYAGGLVQRSMPGNEVDTTDVFWFDVPKEHRKISFTIFLRIRTYLKTI
jgi:hypothetical protein